MFVLGRQVALLYRNLLPGQVISVLNATLLAWGASTLTAHPWLPAWWMLACLVAGLRISMALRFGKSSESERVEQARAWRLRALVGAGLGGIVWAGGALFLMQIESATLEWFTAFLMAGMVAGAVPSLASDRLAFRLYAWPVVLAVAISAYGEDPLHLVFFSLSCLFLFMVTRSADYLHDTLQETLRLEEAQSRLNEQLEEANVLASRSNRSKAEFLANISHELRTPMNAVVGFAELLKHEELTDEQQVMFSHLCDSAQLLMHRIDNLIQLSALEAGHVQFDASLFSLSDLLENALSAQRKAAEFKGLALGCHLEEAVPPVLVGEADCLRQIFGHLLDNAVKFTDQGSVAIDVHLKALEEKKVWLTFDVRDTGVGIHENTLPLLEELLVQGDGSSARRYGGLGVGLPIVRKLIEALGGDLRIESTPGIGSRFSFDLPFVLPDEPVTR